MNLFCHNKFAHKLTEEGQLTQIEQYGFWVVKFSLKKHEKIVKFLRYGCFAKVGYIGWTAVAAPARYQVTLPLQGTLISLYHRHLRRVAISFIICKLVDNLVLSLVRARTYLQPHGLRTPNEGKNQRHLKKWADVADKICCRRTIQFGSGSEFSAVQ